MNRITLSTTLAFAAATPFPGNGADADTNPNRLSFGPRFGLNIKAEFQNTPTVDPGLVSGGANHTYNDGYVLVDSSGGAGGLTWNWGYQNPSQVVGDTMQFHAVQPHGPSSTTDNPQYGAEVVYQRVLGSLPVMKGCCWGIEAGFGFTDIDLRQDRRGSAQVTTDTFPLNGVLPPGAGYDGSFQGPAALLGDTPVRTEIAALASDEKLSGQMFGIRIGPFAEWQFTSKLSLAASVGLSLAPTTLDYDFSEIAIVAGGPALAPGGHSSNTELLYGPYVSGTLRYDFSERWGIYAGAQFQSLTDSEQSIGEHTARLDMGAAVYLTAGVTWKF